ncbi:MAG: hypothetical protein WBN31_07730 [Gammaproteobacteria bacterium]
MGREFDQLKRDYRDIRAPAYLATRIRAEVAAPRKPAHRWIPVAAATMAAFVAVWLMPDLLQQRPAASSGTSTPSYATLAALKPPRPAVRTPGLDQLRSVKVPSISARPQFKPETETDKPQTRIHKQSIYQKEKDHAHV